MKNFESLAMFIILSGTFWRFVRNVTFFIPYLPSMDVKSQPILCWKSQGNHYLRFIKNKVEERLFITIFDAP